MKGLKEYLLYFQMRWNKDAYKVDDISIIKYQSN